MHFEGTNSTYVCESREITMRNHSRRGTLGLAQLLPPLEENRPPRAAQCASLTFISVKEHCTPVERALLLKQRPGRYGFFCSRTIVFNYAPFAAISFFSLGFSALYTERGQNFNFLLCLPIFPEIEIMLASSPPVLVSAVRSICYS